MQTMKFLQIVFLMFIFFVTANAQKTALIGTVYDQSGGVIPNVDIYLRDEKGNKFQSLTDDNGRYRIELASGVYQIEYQMTRVFEPLKIEKYRITANVGQMTLDVSLMGKVLSGHPIR